MIRKVLPLRHGLLAAFVPAVVAISSISPVCAQPAPPTARPLAPLNSVKVPLPENIDEFVRDRAAAVALGKALFWDMQVGSDGKTACATCHFHAGADGRFVNTLSLPKKSPGNAKLTSVLTKLKTSDFPFTRISGNNPLDPAAVVVSSRGEIVGSKGVELRTFQSIQPYSSVDIGIKKSDPTFNFRGVNLRTVTPRNTPSVINSAFNHRNNWDGRASFYFNGVNSYGKFDGDATVTQVSFAYRNSTDALLDRVTGSRKRAIHNVSRVKVLLPNASLASQAVAPPTATEMGWEGRPFEEIGRKILLLRPLAKQEVFFSDSTLAPYDYHDGTGLTVSYGWLIRKAFHEKWWGANSRNKDGYTQMEANFSLYWGIAMLMYQRTLISDDTPLDRFLAGDTTALNPQQQAGLGIFQRGCNICHSGPETTAAAVGEIVQTDGTQKPVTIMLRGQNFDRPTFYDRGYYNTGVQKTDNDLGAGDKDHFGFFSLTLRARAGQNIDQARFDAPINALPVAINGTFKTPGLRNVELTGPFMHNGGMLDLEEVVQFYGRGADFRRENVDNLDQGVSGIAGLQDPTQGPLGVALLTAFMKSMTDERVRNQSGPFDHPQLLLPDGVVGINNGVVFERMVEFPAVGRFGVTNKGLGTIRGTTIKSFRQVLENANK